MHPRRIMLAMAIIALSGVIRSASAADRFFMYNLTATTVFTGVYLAPTGTGNWGANQALNDKDKAIDPSERLAIKEVTRGVYDVKLVNRAGRMCLVRGVDLGKDTTFEIHDQDLTNCH